MSDHGYSAVEALAALLIVSMAFAGLLGGLNVIGRTQSYAANSVLDAELLRSARVELERLVAEQPGLLTDDTVSLTGRPQAFAVECRHPPCAARIEEDDLVIDQSEAIRRIELKGDGPFHFAYRSQFEVSDVWPPAQLPSPVPARRPLLAISIIDEGAGEPLLTVRHWNLQRPDCEFDTVVRACRGVR